jgi:hypothetical protein
MAAEDPARATAATAAPTGCSSPTASRMRDIVASATAAARSAPLARMPVELGRVVEQLGHPGAERGHGLDDDVGNLLLEVAVAAPGELVSRSAIALPDSTEWMTSRLDTPGLVSGS